MATALLQRGADVNAKAAMDGDGVGGQTPIFHAATQYDDGGLAVVRMLVEQGADLRMRATVRGHYDEPGSTVACTPREYAALFPDGGEGLTAAYLLGCESSGLSA